MFSKLRLVLFALLCFTSSLCHAQSVSNLTLNFSEVTGGTSVSGIVFLDANAPSPGVTVSLASSSGAAKVPASVLVPAGATTASFKITTSPVADYQPLSISAQTGTSTVSTPLTVDPPLPKSIVISLTKLVGGSSSNAYVTLKGPAPAGGLSLSIASSSSSATVPALVTVPAGASKVYFRIYSVSVAADTAADISATLTLSSEKDTAQSSLVVLAPTLSKITVGAPDVTGGSNVTVAIYLSGKAPASGLTVNVASSSKAASVPATILIPAGTSGATFKATTSPVGDYQPLSISAQAGAVTVSANLTVDPPLPTSVVISLPKLVGGSNCNAYVALKGPAPTGGLSLSVASSSSSSTVPMTITVPEGETKVYFRIFSVPVASDTTADISATLSLSSEKDKAHGTLVILAPTVKSVTLSNYGIYPGQGSYVIVTINSAAPDSGLTFRTQVNSSLASIPATLTIPGGKFSASVRIATPKNGKSGLVTVSVNDTYQVKLNIFGYGLSVTSAWPKDRGGLQNTGFGVGASNSGTIAWSMATGGAYSPVLDGYGNVYSAGSSSISAIKPDGTLLWKNSTLGTASPTSVPAIADDGSVYFGGGKNLVALNSDGTLKWTFKTGSIVVTSPTIGSDGTVVFSCWDSTIYAVDRLGNKKWSLKAGYHNRSAAAIDSTGNIYIGADDGNLYALDSSGNQLWTFPTRGNGDSYPAIDKNGNILFASDKLYLVSPAGKRIWLFDAGSPFFGTVSPAIGPDGTIYISLGDFWSPALFAINPDGTLKWSRFDILVLYGSPAVTADGTIYFGSLDQNVYALNPDGSVKWKVPTLDGILTSPAIGADGTVYVLDESGNLYSIK